jgi:hypothetical protein
MPVVARLLTTGILRASLFDELSETSPNIGITTNGTFYSAEMKEGTASNLSSSIPMRITNDKKLLVYNSFDELTELTTASSLPEDPPESTTATVSFSYTEFTQIFIVPNNVYWIKVTCNGAGGGQGNGIGSITSGAGGRIVGWIPVEPNEVYQVIVGGGGIGRGPVATNRYGAGGGGFSGLLNNFTNAHIISAGGGGGGQLNPPITTSGVSLSISGGHTIVYNNTPATGGIGGNANSTASSASQLIGSDGTSSGGDGGTTWTGTTTIDAGGGGGGGGYGMVPGTGGDGNNGSNATINTSGKGGNGGYGGGGGGGGGGFGGTSQRTNPGSGGGGGYIGGQGGVNNQTYLHRSGEGGWNFLYWDSNPRGGSTAPLISSTSAGGASGATTAGANGLNGSVTIEY